MMTTTADGGTVRITRAIVESRDTAGALIEEHPPTKEELLILAEWAAGQPSIRDAAATSRVARAPSLTAVRQAAQRLTYIQQGAATLANSPALTSTTNVEALAAIHTLDTRQREIAAALGDIAAVVRAVGLLTVEGTL